MDQHVYKLNTTIYVWDCYTDELRTQPGNWSMVIVRCGIHASLLLTVLISLISASSPPRCSSFSVLLRTSVMTVVADLDGRYRNVCSARARKLPDFRRRSSCVIPWVNIIGDRFRRLRTHCLHRMLQFQRLRLRHRVIWLQSSIVLIGNLNLWSATLKQTVSESEARNCEIRNFSCSQHFSVVRLSDFLKIFQVPF